MLSQKTMPERPGGQDDEHYTWSVPESRTAGDLGDLVEQIKDYQLTHGSMIKLVRTSEGPTVLSRPIGVSVRPTIFPRERFEEAINLQKAYNQLYAGIAEDPEWLEQALGSLIATDPFTRSLWDIHKEAGGPWRAETVSLDHQPVTLGIFRSDYMLHLPGESPEPSGSASCFDEARLKQVEFNTFSVAGGAHGTTVARMHQHLHRYNGQDPSTRLPRNPATQSIVDGLAGAHAAYGASKTGSPLAILFIAQPNNINVCDERPLEYGLWERDPPIEAHRLEFGTPVLFRTTLGRDGALLYKIPGRRALEISVVYFRAGYEADEYDADGVAARFFLEKSRAVKCPSVLAHLATFKKVQQALVAPGAVERFLPPREAAAVRKTFAPLYTLDGSEEGLRARGLARDPAIAVKYVLKPSLEGGGHNVYGADIPGFLETVPEREWQNYVLMSLIQPPHVSNTLMSPQGLYRGPVVSELGAFGVVMWERKAKKEEGKLEILKNENGGWSFKTKAAHVNEMSVIKGYGCFDCPALGQALGSQRIWRKMDGGIAGKKLPTPANGSSVRALWRRAFARLQACAASGPFLKQLNGTTWIVGNDHWNMTQNEKYGTKLYWRGKDLVDEAVGHYVSYNGAANDLAWTSAEIFYRTDDYIDVQFNAAEGEFHWVIYNDLVGAYQYFVNHALPVLGEFRTLWRLDNESFPNGRTTEKDGALPAFADYLTATKVQDETWQKADGTYLTKYDWSAFIREQDYYGVYGDEFGSWYINPGKDYYNGNHLKQELTVHRESLTGDAVQLNMIHGTHFQASSSDAFADGKLWGPWLWYLNDGSQADAAARAEQEFAAWPYTWFENAGYQTRVPRVTGRITLSDGRPAAGAAVFLGDNQPNKTALDQGSLVYYTTYADDDGAFAFDHVLTGTYGLQAWSNGGALADVPTSFLQNDIVVSPAAASRKRDEALDLGDFSWAAAVEGRERVFQVGDFDRKSLGFKYGGAPYQHALVSKCPANLTYTVGKSQDADWCFGQSAFGAWVIEFELYEVPADRGAVLTVSLAGYSQGTSANVFVNGQANKVGNMTSGAIPSDQCLYRSATTAGEWHFFEFPFEGGKVLKEGWNTVSFVVTASTQWRGFLWDSIILDWA
ncbi:putative rhamnogalacturonate lyase protein [Neofusicoccum parvum UCRNP2]|uniref:Putative rhamnogalacturonate lyase protein n=1 Tax=Botryosphaeria parva (strain UCR-NP2) TaxID=1287680 RepID=R1GLK8_BOTPV|nr:putative rhamnogalacturonate lyase protein [Neofusicoccum parvum UCRNP2]